MKAFAALLDALIYTRSRNDKLVLIADYMKAMPDPDRGWTLAALTGGLSFGAVKSAVIRGVAATRVDPVLLGLSRDYVGDSAETVALIWPRQGPDAPSDVSLAEVVDTLSGLTRANAPATIEAYLDRFDAGERYAFLKLATGALRVGISARLAKTGFAQAFGVSVDEVEELWHAMQPPYTELFAWAEGKSPRPDLAERAFFRPFMLAHPLEGTLANYSDYAAEWKWDGIRVQVAGAGGEVRLFSRGAEEISHSFPEVVQAFDQHGVVDGELLVRGDAQGHADKGGEAGSFNALQQRLGRKVVPKAMLESAPAFVRLYDILFDGDRDVRALPWTERRAILERFAARLPPSHFDISPVIDAPEWETLAALRESARNANIEGMMLKRRDSPYVTGRVTGLWYKWKRDPLTADCVMMYAQRGSGKRSSFYSDFTFGCWTEEGELLPVGKAYTGFTDAELKMLDQFVRSKTVNRFGPVREVEKTLVLEVAFDAIQSSTRHKSGLAMRFPRIKRIRTDKPAAEADKIATLRAMIG